MMPLKYWIVTVTVLSAGTVSLYFLNRNRNKRLIVGWLHARGNEALSIRRAQVGRIGWDRRQICYLVEYTTREGRPERKLCLVSGDSLVDQGLFWREIEEDDLLPGDWQCFECRARIPKEESVCPKCGWS